MLPQEESAGDIRWMREALTEARRGIGRTSPNPAVGAILVQDGRELARGWHRAAGKPHAEIEALSQIPPGSSVRGATLYVTLEPCSSHGRTPPCTEAIQQAGLGRVVYGATDPDPRHAGRAQEILTSAGIAVTTGVLEKECTGLNQRWNHYIRTRRPWVILKAGATLDGRIARPLPPGENKKSTEAADPEAKKPSPLITSTAARTEARRLRSEVDAVLVGAGTVREDNPQLTLRGRGLKRRRQPWRVVWSRHPENLPAGAGLFQDEWKDRTLISQATDFTELLHELGQREITSLLVEGGSAVHGAVVDSRLINEVVIYLAPVIFGGGLPMVGGRGVADWPEGLEFENLQAKAIGRSGDVRLQALVRESKP
jgi:diaminohydroxyphosphoribosylaminopyrimidine deaminase/5-amino-6-(5-phosphoribosylamino)uracil reductase